jgi:hypothetical protein
VNQIFLLCCVVFLSSCAGPITHLQPKVNSLLSEHQFDAALQTLGDSPLSYGPKNQLLYWLDKGMVLHLAGRYRESIDAFEQAKHLFDELYTQSIHDLANSFLINDYGKNYRGTDEEYVLLNVFQALNFVALGDIHESLVEARDVDVKLKLINDHYPNKENVYRDDAFARLLMGILYQADGTMQSLQDARISLEHADHIYTKDYEPNYGVSTPKILNYVKERPDYAKAQVYLIQYTGFAPIKEEGGTILPAGGLLLTKVVFPKYVDRIEVLAGSNFIAHGAYTDVVFPTEVGENIGAIAKQILKNHEFIIGAQAILRPGVKVAGEKIAEQQMRKHYGDLAGLGIDLIGSIYNLSTEKADLRSWATLPNEIRIARLVLEPGQYEFYVQNLDGNHNQLEKKDLGSMEVKAGDVKFFVVRSYY